MKHPTVMSILDHKHGVDDAWVFVDSLGVVVGKILSTHAGQTDWLTLWDFSGTTAPTYQTASGKYCTVSELLEGMTFRGVRFNPGNSPEDMARRFPGITAYRVV